MSEAVLTLMVTDPGEKVLVLGGGVIGLSIAFRLVQAGFAVTVIDRGAPGNEASTAAGGILGPQLENRTAGPLLDLTLRSRTLYPAFVRELEALTGLTSEYRELGVLRLAFNDDEAHDLVATAEWQRAFGLRAELLEKQELEAFDPSVSPEAVAGLFFPDDHQLDPRRLVAALVAACERLGVQFVRAEIEALLTRDGAVRGVKTSGGELAADRVVVALGAWSGEIPGLGFGGGSLPVEPIRGQIVELEAGDAAPAHLLYGGGCYVVPRADGRVLVGSTMEKVGFDKTTTDTALRQLRERAERLCPGLRRARVRDSWAGLRPGTGDQLPILGAGPLTGLLLATGHFRNGVLLAPITARLVVECMRGRPSVDLKPFRFDRSIAD